MVTDGGIATVGERTRASTADTSYIIRVSAEDSGFDSTSKTKIQTKSETDKRVRREKDIYLAI